MVAVGIGNFDLACTGSFPGSISCEDYKWTVPADGVVLVYRLEEWPQGPIEPYPSPNVQSGDKWVEVDRRTALFSQDDGIMRWDMLGTPEVIEAHFGNAVADAAPQEVQAVIDSWQWRAPSATPRPSPVITGGGSATYEWQKVGAGAGVFPTWAPDSNHLLVDVQNANEFDQVALLDRSGNSVANIKSVVEPIWLTSDAVEVYEGGSVPDYAQRDHYLTAPGTSIVASDGTASPVSLPCCEPLPNGHGAVAFTRFLPEKVTDIQRPRFVVWQDGVESAESDGYPVAWDVAGDTLLVIHPTQANWREPEGTLEVLSWPGLAPLYQDDPANAIPRAEFDPTGRYVSYDYYYSDASNSWHDEIHVIDIGARSRVAIPVPDYPQARGGYVWDDQSRLLVMSPDNLTLTTYLPNGTQVDQTSFDNATFLQASANGATILATQYGDDENPSNLQLLRAGTSKPLTLPLHEVQRIYLSPDGTQVLVTAYSPADDGDAGYLTDLP